MGVPALFRWLTNKYPNVISKVIDEKPQIIDGNLVPVDWSKPNPNGFEMDNLFLDMNGIVHPCCHPEDKAAPATEDEMYNEIFRYLDHIMRMIRPRNLVYMAVDGVAPRAKMNQQRSRRFRAALDSFEKLKAEEEFQASKEPANQDDTTTKHFDSNCITPGTPFMERLSVALKYYLSQRMSTDPAWANVKVVLSDSSVPGEGEHKIMDFIRRQRMMPGYNPNMKHVIYGLDADLIMLSLATHEINFRVLREDVFVQQSSDKNAEADTSAEDTRLQAKPFVFFHIPILREYLEFELRPADPLPFKWDLDRAIDDWVFLCFFVGNDFLPHLPSLEIREGAIDLLVEIYKRHLPCFDDYVTSNGNIDLKKAEVLLNDVGRLEDDIFRNRREKEERFRERRKQQRSAEAASVKQAHEVDNSDEIVLEALPGSYSDKKETIVVVRDGKTNAVKEKSAAVEQPEEKDESSSSSDTEANADVEETVVFEPPKALVSKSDSDSEPDDNVKLWEPGWKGRYYLNKFDTGENDEQFRAEIVRHYVTGLCWVLAYYYQGCQSWNWYFPYHFSPFASDFVNLESINIQFELASPLKPFEQLMGVLPAASRAHIPRAWQSLMTDANSAIIDYYPADFPVDMNGKKHAWQGVAILPFIDEKRLLSALAPVYPLLRESEVIRNSRGSDFVYFTPSCREVATLCERLYGANGNAQAIEKIRIESSRQTRYPFFGALLPDPDFHALGSFVQSIFHFAETPDISRNARLSARYFNPEPKHESYVFPSKLLNGAVIPPKVLTYQDFQYVKTGGRNFSNGGQPQQRRPHLHLVHVQRMISNILGPPPPLNSGKPRYSGPNFASFNTHKYSQSGPSRPARNGNRYQGNNFRESYNPYPSLRFDNSFKNADNSRDARGSGHSYRYANSAFGGNTRAGGRSASSRRNDRYNSNNSHRNDKVFNNRTGVIGWGPNEPVSQHSHSVPISSAPVPLPGVPQMPPNFAVGLQQNNSTACDSNNAALHGILQALSQVTNASRGATNQSSYDSNSYKSHSYNR